MKTTVKFITKAEFAKWVSISNLFANSLLSPRNALLQFNRLSPKERTEINHAYNLYDSIRRRKIPKGEIDSAWKISVMVDSHIIATEHNIDPLAAVMCIRPPCKVNEKVFVK